MVYSGKPSKACLPCRKRKIRVLSKLVVPLDPLLIDRQCDLQRSSCGQCARAALVCTGYRDTEKIRIRDESQKTRQKALSRNCAVLPQALRISIVDRARNIFFSHFVFGFSRTFDVLGMMYSKSLVDKHLAASVDAASLAFLSFHFNFPRASHSARMKYTYALPLLNDALLTPRSARSDSTLLAILLLDLFEKILNRNPRSPETWMSHINGASALIKQRKYTGFLSHVDVRLGMRFTTTLLTSCIAANTPVPSELTELRSKLEPYVDKEDIKWIISGLVVKYADLKGEIQAGRLSSADTIVQAAELDQEFATLATMMPPRYYYTTTYLEANSVGVLERHFDVYLDHLTTQAWNNLRALRMLLQDTIRIQCAIATMDPGRGFSASQSSDNATCVIDDLAKDVCASAPQYYLHGVASSNSEEWPTIQATRCHTLLFSLYVAGMHASPATKIKPWIIRQLRFMSRELSIPNAGVVADVLGRADATSPWSVYAMLGCYAFSG